MRLLWAGRYVDFDDEAVIRFDRGGGAGLARYVLRDGTYRFVPVDGLWSLARDDEDLVGEQADEVATNPQPGAG